MKWHLDLGKDEDTIIIPFDKRKSISILIGAGFSAPMGYPVGNKLNDCLLNFDDRDLDFAPDGTLVVSNDGTKPKFQVDGITNIHQEYFAFCKKLIKEYTSAHNNIFDYEKFYDFIKSEEAKEERYRRLCDDVSNIDNYDNWLFNVSHIYNQMTAFLLRDKNGQSWYDAEPFRINSFEGYNGFLSWLSELSKDYIVNVHTLNHDLLFESFNKTGFINGNISDGFDEFGSNYYGRLSKDGETYHCRLKRYTGRYTTSIRLYKLHGSLDYVPYYRRDRYGIMTLEKYVKIRRDIGPGDIMKGCGSKMTYEMSPFEYHPDFLTGTTSKIERYKEPLLFKKLFKKFRNNLKQAEKLIIIGYGCKDEGINEMIRDNFDYSNKPSYIVDAYASKGSQVEIFRDEINASLLREQIEKIDKGCFE